MLKKLLIFLGLAVSFVFFVSQAFASTLYLSPGSANIPLGSTISVSVGLNTGGDSINGVSAYLSYPSDKLEVTYASCVGAFGIAAERSYGGGGIRISCGSISGASGSVTVATIGLRGKGEGKATVSFIGGSAAARTADSSDSLNLGGSAGGVYTIGPASKSSAPSPNQTGAPSTASPKDTIKPVISNILISKITVNTATITWTTTEDSDSAVEYGLNPNKYFLSSSDKKLTAKHSVVLDASLLTPGLMLNFRVKSKDASGNEAVSINQTLQLKGYTVTVRILDTNNKPVTKDTEVLLYSDPVRSKTSSNGEAVFSDVTPGKHLVVVKLKGSDKTGEIDVKDSPSSQSFFIIVDATASNTSSLIVYVFTLIVLVGAGAFIFITIKRKPTKPDTSADTNAPPAA